MFTNLLQEPRVYMSYTTATSQGNDKRVIVVVNCLSEKHMQKFIEANGKAMASSGTSLSQP